MKKDEIVFTTRIYDSKMVPRRVCLILSFLLLLACAIKAISQPYILIPLIIFMLLIAICLFFSWRTSYRRRSYITLTDNEIRGVSYPARDCTSGFYFFSVYYMEIQHVDVEKNFIILYTYFGRYKVFTETEGPLIKYYIDEHDTEKGKELFEKSKKSFEKAINQEKEKKENKKRRKKENKKRRKKENKGKKENKE